MRDFFQHQDRARRNSGWLVFLFAFAVIAIAAGVYFATILILRHPGFRPPREPAPEIWNAKIFFSFFIGTLVIIIFSSLLRMGTLRSGGSAVAEMLGGQLVPPGSTDLHHRRLLNVVEEMALASGVPVPQVYVLEGEAGINAFAAGHSPNDAAVIATRGCIEKLNREELQGVIAHEFSHVLNGDMRLKLQLMGLIFGILVISVIGRGVLRMTRVSSRSSRGGKGGALLLGVVVAGLALTILGYIGLFCGRLIKAAVSRQREFLADASAVQFTRNPQGIAGALKKIGGFLHGSQVAAAGAEETSHFFFSKAVSYALFSGFFATHPPLVERIRRIDPAFDGEFPPVPEGMVPVGEFAPPGAEAPVAMAGAAPTAAAPAPGAGAAGAPEAAQAVDPQRVLDQVGRPRPEHAREAAALKRRLPAEIQDAVRDPFSAGALIFALLLSEHAATQERQAGLIKHHSGERFLRESWRLAAALVGFDPRWRLPIVQLALPVLRQMTPAQQEAFTSTVQGLIEADEQVTVFEFALSRTLLRNLAASRGRRGPGPLRRSLSPLRRDCAILLSALARFGSGEETAAARAFAAGVQRLGTAGAGLTLLAADEISLAAVDRALGELPRTTPRLREQILEACAHCVLADRKVTVTEAELLRVVADALDCPMPEFMTSAA